MEKICKMANDWFQFKKFLIKQSASAMKVGTDGVLLGAWVNLPSNSIHVLDIGTGTGLISLILAQRFPGIRITGIEIDDLSCPEAKENIKNSPWNDRIRIQNISLQDYNKKNKGKFDLIVTNPPFFANSMKPPELNRANARHQDNLTSGELFASVINLLNPDRGIFSLIIPFDQKNQIQKIAESVALYPARITNIRPNPAGPFKRCMMEFSFKSTQAEEDEMIIELERHKYSDKYKELTRDFYLNF